MHRRSFLQLASALGTGSLLINACSRSSATGAPQPSKAPEPAKTPKAASASASFPIGLQLYTLREPLAKDFEGTLAKTRAIGYQELEFAGYYDRSPEQIGSALARHGFSAPAAHVKMQELRESLSEAVERSQAMGHRLVICSSPDKDRRDTLAQFSEHAKTLNRAAEACKRSGLSFGYHNHAFEFDAIEGTRPFDVLLAETDSQLVKLELDIYWLVHAKQDPVAMLKQHAGRVVALHVKDMDKQTGSFAPVGDGSIDYPPILGAAKASGVQHYFVEQDRCTDTPLNSVKRSYEYLSKVRI